MNTDSTTLHLPPRLRSFNAFMSAFLVAALILPLSGCAKEPQGSLLIAFPTGATGLRLVFSEPVDPATAEQPSNYTAESGLEILEAFVDPDDPKRVTLTTEPMDGDAMIVDTVRAGGVRTASGAPLAESESPRFLQGIASITEVQKPAEEVFPFTSRYEGIVSGLSCGKDGGVDSHVLVDLFGFAFIHREAGGPYNSIKVVTQKHIPGVAEAAASMPEGKTPHVYWTGGEIRTVDGEIRLIDTGFLEGSVIEPNPLNSPPPYPIKTAEISGDAASEIGAKRLQGVIVRFENITIDSISEPDERGLRSFVFHDESGGQVTGLALHTVTRSIEPGETFEYMRGLVHQPEPQKYEVLLELEEHLKVSTE